MSSYISSMPSWAIVSFILAFFISFIFIAYRFRQAALDGGLSSIRSRRIYIGIVVFFTAFFVYVSVLSLCGLLDKPSLPPMVIVYGALPLTIFLFGIFGKTPLYKKLFQAITLESLITVHMFRIIGIYFILLYFYDLLPSGFAFSAGLGDIITAVLAVPVAKMFTKEKSWRIPVIYAWNIFGLFDVANLLVIALIIVKNSLDTGAQGIREIDLFPFSFFAAFAPPILLFLHIMVFKKIKISATVFKY